MDTRSMAFWSVATFAAALAGAVLWLASVALLAIAPPIAGFEGVVVTGDSMSPSIPAGSVAVLRRADEAALEAGDVVTYRAGNGVRVTHRILSISDSPDGRLMVTQGDANTRPDARPVPASAVEGRVVMSVAYAGYLAIFISSPAFIAFAGGMTLIFFAGLPVTSWFRKTAKGGVPLEGPEEAY